MELIINLYQEKADQALAEMRKAMQEYEATKDSVWLIISMEWEIKAHYYLSLAEQVLEALSCHPKDEKVQL